ncbi:hypothetical protein G7Y31_06630 [Corynebacterium lizhenjunii]|uniref:Uncharacterized protein n=1 Tax=Corynebacterium lizhenjunii TaxID=2709394 RepID=A0A7T0KCH9_9CORY|nr:hypothetical protein [Corynebacterium lizhenjunii]QPK78260.1 hypothetical protein G7Y31_06630 [Corynebacterium lizhenjunii]
MPCTLTYISPGGASYELFTGRYKEPFIEQDSLTGFVGTFEDNPVETVGVPGARVDFRDRVIRSIEGEFAAVVFNRAQWAQLRRDFSTRRAGELVLDCGQGAYHLKVRLRAPLPAPSVVPDLGTRLVVGLVADGGVWESFVSAPGPVVTVTNPGDVPIWPVVVWNGAGGAVTLPSGVQFRLPAVTQEYRLPLDRLAGGRALPTSGDGAPVVVDMVGECVPVDQTRTYRLPSGARLEYTIGVFDPWI